MRDEYLPTVDISFMHQLISGCDKVKDIIKIGDTTAYVLDGMKSINKRLILLRDTPDGVVDFDFATAKAIQLKCMGTLLQWLEDNRNWKDGAYFERV